MNGEPVKITAISPQNLVEILRKSGSREVSAETLSADIEAGAPVGEDGTINMIEYAAWLVNQAGGRRPEAGGKSLQPTASSLQPKERSDDD